MAYASVDPAVLVYATRYALGRATGAPTTVAAAVRANAHTLDPGCLSAITADVRAYLDSIEGTRPGDRMIAATGDELAWRGVLGDLLHLALTRTRASA